MEERTSNIDYILRQLLTDTGQQLPLPSSLPEKQRMMRALMNIRQPIPASQTFLKAQNEELLLQAEERGIVELKDGETKEPKSATSRFLNTFIILWQGDITRLRVDAIVNAANAQGLGCWAPLHNCIDNCIHSAAGIQLRQECNDQLQGRLLKTGKAIITQGYNLPAKHVVHTVGPIIPQGLLPTAGQEEQLAACYRSCLDLAAANRLRSIVFCCISTGVFNFPGRRAAEIAVDTVKQWLAEHQPSSVAQVIFNVFLDKDHEIYQRLLATP